MRVVAIDTETELIADRDFLQRKSSKLNTEAHQVPELICGSFCTETEHGVLAPDELRDLIAAEEYADSHIVFHNASFDVAVLIAAYPRLEGTLMQLARRDHMHDTMLFEILLGLATGRYDIPRGRKFERDKPYPETLDALALRHLNRALPKDNDIRLAFGQWKNRVHEMPPSFEKYAIDDAVATYDVFWAQHHKLEQFARERRWPAHVVEQRLSEGTQLRAQWVFSTMDRKGVNVDSAEARRLRDHFSQDLPALKEGLVKARLGRWDAENVQLDKMPISEFTESQLAAMSREWTPSTALNGLVVKFKVFKNVVHRRVGDATFHLCTNNIRTRLEKDIVPGMDDEPPTTETGLLSLDADFWSKYIPKDNVPLRTWREYMRLEKILGTYLNLYSELDMAFPRWNVIGARSGRVSCSSPNLQNVPKRKYGIRSLFVPPPGHVWIVADYSTQELFTLAEAMHHMGIEGPLLRAIRNRVNLHKNTASLISGVPLEEVTKQMRQDAKAINFGVPGGLGPAKLAAYAETTYGVKWTLSQARHMRNKFLAQYPDIAQFLQSQQVSLDDRLTTLTGRGAGWWKREVGLEQFATLRDLKQRLWKHTNTAYRRLIHDAERIHEVILPSGRVRKGCLYTEAANTHFQGLASDVTKRAMWRVHCCGLDLRLAVHDELVVAVPADGDVERFKKLIEHEMVQAFVDICPVVGPYATVEAEVLPRWGVAKDKDGKELDCE